MIVTVLLPTKIEVEGKLCGKGCPGRAGYSYLCRYFPTKRAPDRVLKKTKDGRHCRCSQCLAVKVVS